jgi:Fe-S oxidoreductase
MAAQRDQAQADARAQKAAKTRIKNDRDRIKTRVANGVCPHCNRTFQNLARHMASQHPDCQHND